MAVGLLLGCEKAEVSQSVAEAAPVETEPRATRPQTETEPPKPIVVSAALATFRSERLDECVDFALELPADASEEEMAEVRGRLTGSAGDIDGAKTISLRKSCSEQFQDRAPVATCIVSGNTAPFRDGTVQAVAASTYYQDETARKDDTFMRQCLEVGGDWKEHGPAPKPSPPISQRKSRLLQKLEAEGKL